MNELRRIGSFANSITRKNLDEDSSADVYSVTKYDGFVRSLDYFKKQVFSRDLSTYKIVRKGEFAYSTIHLDEGAIGLLEDEEALISPMYTVFQVDKSVDIFYLNHLFSSKFLLNQYGLIGQGSVNRRKSISFASFADLKVRIPPMQEQKKITEILSTIDKLIQINKVKLSKLDLLKNALIQKLLFKGLFSHSFHKTSIGIFPKNWNIVGINSICKSIKRGPSLSTNSTGKGIRYITSGNIVNDKISLEADFKFLDAFDGIDKCLIQRDDLILNCVNSKAKLASSALYKSNISSIVGFNNYALTLDKDKCLPSFIFYWTKTSNFHNQVKSFSKPAINQVSFSKKDLENIYIPLPTLEEQSKISQLIDPIISLKEDLEKKINKFNSLKIGLENDLLSGRIRVSI